ncbi:hypothetical protein BD769DRAFT_1386829 [Suillus cothurnatus]|nr:hypothetical protein BD769DRAFT_1386829 [Suillus cothurnatus]
MVQIAPLLQVLAAAAQVPPVARSVSPNALAARQVSTSQLPSQCQSTCQVVNTINTSSKNCSSDLSCICGSSIGTQLETCLNCVVLAEPDANSEAQSVIESWNEACNGTLTLSSGSTSTSTTAKGSTATSSSSSTSNPFVSKTGDAVGVRGAIGALGLVVAIACGAIIF